MTQLLDRDFIAQALVSVCVCIGSWMMLVKPKMQEFSDLQGSIAQASLSTASVANNSIESLTKRMEPMRERYKHLQDCNQLADDSSRLYGSVMDMAEVHHVTVQSMQPGASLKTTPDGQMSTRQIEMSVKGSYANIAGFLNSLARLDAFIRPSTLQIVPVHGEADQLVIAEFGCELMIFKFNDALAILAEKADAQP